MTPPPIHRTLLDVPRGLLEQWSFFWGNVFSWPLPLNDGDSVLLIPGLGADDWQMYMLRNELRRRGFDAETWGLGRNWGARTVGFANRAIVQWLFRKKNHVGKTTLIGWSLGGLQARSVAADHPHLVRSVITLGSPFVDPSQATNIGWLYELLTGQSVREHKFRPVPVPALSIYSRSDGVVAPEGCIDPTGQTRSVEVSGAHTGLATNRKALRAITEFMTETRR